MRKGNTNSDLSKMLKHQQGYKWQVAYKIRQTSRFATISLARHIQLYYYNYSNNIYTATHNIKVASFSGLTSFLCRMQYRKIVHGKKKPSRKLPWRKCLGRARSLRMREDKRYALLATLSAHSILDEGDFILCIIITRKKLSRENILIFCRQDARPAIEVSGR